MHLVGFIIRNYNDARSPKRQKKPYYMQHALGVPLSTASEVTFLLPQCQVSSSWSCYSVRF